MKILVQLQLFIQQALKSGSVQLNGQTGDLLMWGISYNEDVRAEL